MGDNFHNFLYFSLGLYKLFFFIPLTSFGSHDNIPTKFSMIEARFSSVSARKARQPRAEKGGAAEGSSGVCRNFAWAIGKHPLDCHDLVKRYHGSIRDHFQVPLCV